MLGPTVIAGPTTMVQFEIFEASPLFCPARAVVHVVLIVLVGVVRFYMVEPLIQQLQEAHGGWLRLCRRVL